MYHSFDTDVAKEYGILEAVLLNHIGFWIAKNRANGENFHDGRYWTYNSMKAFGELFPYVSQKQIRRALSTLVSEGVLVTGNYNKSAYDRTLWYSITDKGTELLERHNACNSISSDANLHLPKRENGNACEGEPIPDINTDINTDRNHIERGRFTPPTLPEVKAYCEERKNNVDPEQWFDFYSSKGWKVGNQPMKDWRAAVRTWERRDKPKEVKHDFGEYNLDW